MAVQRFRIAWASSHSCEWLAFFDASLPWSLAIIGLIAVAGPRFPAIADARASGWPASIAIL
jgi:hypothetical protein